MSLLGAVVALWVLAPLASAQTGSVTREKPTERPQTVSLANSVLMALEHNLDITVSRRTREIRLTDIIVEQAKFDPTINLSGRYDRDLLPLNRPFFGLTGASLGEPRTLDSKDLKLGLGLAQKLPTGANYELRFNPERNHIEGARGFVFNPSYASGLRLTITQPLLRDFGLDVNRTQILIAQNNAKVEDQVFRDRLFTVISTVEQTYWELVFANENLKVTQAALRAAEELLAGNRAKEEAGIMANVEVLQAQAGVASRKEQILIAEKSIRDQEDLFRRLLGSSLQELRRNVRLMPIDQPDQTPTVIKLDEAIDSALERRPEVLHARKSMESSNLNTKFARNQILPNLAFQGTAGLAGLGRDPVDMAQRNFSGDFYNWGVGLILSYPLGNRSAWSQYNKRQLETRNAEATLEGVQQLVIVDVREAARRVETDFSRIETARASRILAEKQLEAGLERLNAGLTITRFVLDFQRDLAVAQGSELRAVVDYNKALSNLARQKATTLDHYHIDLR